MYLIYNHLGGLIVRVLNMGTRQIVDIPEIQSINRVGEKLYWDWPMGKHLDTKRKSAHDEVYLIQLYVVSWSVRSFHMFVLYKVCQ
jgi:hypothetical protein